MKKLALLLCLALLPVAGKAGHPVPIKADSETGQIEGISVLDFHNITVLNLPGGGSGGGTGNVVSLVGDNGTATGLTLTIGGTVQVPTITLGGTLSWGHIDTATANVLPQAAITGLTTALAAKATNSAVLHTTGAETKAGVLTLTSAPVVPSNSFPESAVTSLVTDLAAKQTHSANLDAVAAISGQPYGLGVLAQDTDTNTRTYLGLGNVDNTSDATKNSAAVSLTNHTIDGRFNSLTHIPTSAIEGWESSTLALSPPDSTQGLVWDTALNSGLGAFRFMGSPAVRGLNKEICLAVRTDGNAGTGTAEDPFDASGTKYDTIMAGYATAGTTNLSVHLIGTGFQTNVATTGLGSAFYVKNGWRIHGDGMYVTTLTMVGSMAGQHYDHEAFKAPSTSPASYTTISDLTIDANYATLSTTADTTNSEKFYVAYGVGICGSYNTVERVRLINQYGTFANGGESFGIALGAATAGSVGATIRNCVVELPHGTYAGAPFACGGIDVTHLMSDWSVHDNFAYGTNDGITTATFNTGGVNIAYSERGEIYNNHFVDCRGIVYSDTGNVKTLRIHNNRAVRAWQGVGFVSDEVAQPTWTKTDISCSGNVISIQDRTGGEFSAFRFAGGSGISIIGSNIVTKLSGGVGGGGAWTVLADASVDTITVNDLIGPNENASIVGTNVMKNRNRTPVGGTITGLEDTIAATALASITLNPSSGDSPIFFQKNSVAKWQLSSVGSDVDEFRLYNYGTSTSAFEIAKADNAAHFTGSFLSDSTIRGTKVGIGVGADRLLTIQRAGTTVNTEIGFKDQLGANIGSIGVEAASSNDMLVASNAGLRWYSNSTIGSSGTPTNERMRLSLAGGLSIGSTTDAGATNLLVAGLIKAGSGPTTLTDSAGKILSASLNTVGVAQGGTGDATLTAYAPLFGGTTSTGAVQSGTVGTSGQVLTSNGAGALPTFQAAAGGSDQLGLTPTAVKTANYTAVAGDLVPVDTTSGAVTITLPTAPADKSVVAIKHVIQGGTNTVSLAVGGSDVFNKASGSTSGTLTLVNQGILLQYKSSGAIWYAVADDIPLSGMDSRFATASQGTLAASAVQPSTAPTLTATNFTGTASMNINGTVGATTPTTGAFTSLTSTAASTLTLAPAANTAATGWLLTDTTAATSGNQQYSPAVRWTGQGWKTTATAASQGVDFRAYVLPVQGTANPSGSLVIESAVNGGAFANPWKFYTNGYLSFGYAMGGGSAGSIQTTGAISADGSITANGSNVDANNYQVHSGGFITWSNGSNYTNTGLARQADALVEVNTGTAISGTSNAGSIKALTFIPAGTATTCTGGTIGSGSKSNAGFVTATTTGTSTIVITFPVTAPTGWTIMATNMTTATGMFQSAKSTTTATITGATTSGDVVQYMAMAY